MDMLLQDIYLGKVLKSMRVERKMSQSDLIRELHLLGSTLSRSTYSKIEIGLGNLKISDLVFMKKVFDVDYADFFKDFE